MLDDSVSAWERSLRTVLAGQFLGSLMSADLSEHSRLKSTFTPDSLFQGSLSLIEVVLNNYTLDYQSLVDGQGTQENVLNSVYTHASKNHDRAGELPKIRLGLEMYKDMKAAGFPDQPVSVKYIPVLDRVYLLLPAALSALEAHAELLQEKDPHALFLTTQTSTALVADVLRREVDEVLKGRVVNFDEELRNIRFSGFSYQHETSQITMVESLPYGIDMVLSNTFGLPQLSTEVISLLPHYFLGLMNVARTIITSNMDEGEGYTTDSMNATIDRIVDFGSHDFINNPSSVDILGGLQFSQMLLKLPPTELPNVMRQPGVTIQSLVQLTRFIILASNYYVYHNSLTVKKWEDVLLTLQAGLEKLDKDDSSSIT